MPKQNKNFKKHHKYIKFVIISIPFVVIIVQSFFIYQLKSQVKPLVDFPIKELISQALDGLYTDLPVDAKTGVYYIAPAKLSLPATTNLNNRFSYSYSPKSEDGEFSEEIHLNVKNLVSKAKVEMYSQQGISDTFSVVPKLQACARGYLLKFVEDDNDDDYGEVVFTKTLSDGRNLYVRLDKGCTEPNDEALTYLKQIDSY